MKELKLNLSRLTMDVDPSTVDELIFPRAMLATYDQLYRDIMSLRKLLSKVMDLTVDTDGGRVGVELSTSCGGGFGLKKGVKDVVRNRAGPVPIWVLHDPFVFDCTTLSCPVSVPFKTLSGFKAISTTASGRNALLNFGFDAEHNLIVVITGLTLSGLSFDECNFVINALYGVLGHKNLYFTNMFYAFPTATMYSDDGMLLQTRSLYMFRQKECC